MIILNVSNFNVFDFGYGKGRVSTYLPLMGLVKKGHEVYWLTSAKEVESGDDQKLNADGIKVHRFSYFEFIQFLYVAKCSASELQSQLYIASDLKYIPDADFKALYGLSEETIKLISGFIKYLKGS